MNEIIDCKSLGIEYCMYCIQNPEYRNDPELVAVFKQFTSTHPYPCLIRDYKVWFDEGGNSIKNLMRWFPHQFLIKNAIYLRAMLKHYHPDQADDFEKLLLLL